MENRLKNNSNNLKIQIDYKTISGILLFLLIISLMAIIVLVVNLNSTTKNLNSFENNKNWHCVNNTDVSLITSAPNAWTNQNGYKTSIGAWACQNTSGGNRNLWCDGTMDFGKEKNYLYFDVNCKTATLDWNNP